MRPLRHPWVVRCLAWVFSSYLKLVYRTLRWTVVDGARAETVWQDGSGVILCFWHAQIPYSPQSWPLARGAQDMRALISLSADGEFIAQAMHRLGFPAIRGSSQKKTDPTKNKQGEQAFRDMVRWVKGGGGVAITPDGPRGPARVMQPGTPALAKVCKAPVLFVGLASSPCLRLNSWDQTVVPLPFGRAAMVWDGPVLAEREDDPDTLCRLWQDRLTQVTERAETLVRG